MIDPRHEESVLLPRGITAAQAESFGVRSISDPSELPDVFLVDGQPSRYAVGSGLLFEWHSPLAGTVLQFRPDSPAKSPAGDFVKYAFPVGTSMVLNDLRSDSESISRDEKWPILLAEGTMQSLAAAIYAPPDYAVYGMSGCWSWRKGETQVATPDLLVVEGRDVIVALDADAATNLDVYNAGMALKDALDAEGASTVSFLRLDGHGAKAGLDDVLGARPADTRSSYLARLLERAEEKPAKKAPPKKKASTGTSVADLVGSGASGGRPVIMVNDDRYAVINQMTDVLRNRWSGDELFCYGKILVRRDGASVKPVTKGTFANLIAEAALTVTVNAKGDAAPAWPDEPSRDAVLDRSDQFAPLQRIARVPFVRADGSICQTSGYDEETSTYVVLDESLEGNENIPEQPTEDDVASAVKLLCDEWLGDLMSIMPEPEDRANCLGLILTTLVRGLVPLAPMAVVDGLQMGVGKNLLADLLSIFATGQASNPLPYSRDDEENRKVITSSFRAGHDLLVFDEAHVIEGRQLARAITSITYSDRILGVSNMIEFPNNVTWVALGNNVSVNADLARRVYRIRLAPSVENPQDRDADEFKHPNIKRWTREHRHELVTAALTLVRAWFAGDRKENRNGRRFGSFEQWGGMVGGILDNAGIEGFLGSLAEWRSETDYETRFWTQHMTWLSEQFGEKDFTVSEVVQAMKMQASRAPGSVEHPPRLEDHTISGYNRLLGLGYKKVQGRILERLQIVKTVESPGHGSRWKVVAHGQGGSLSTSNHPAPDLGGYSEGITGNGHPLHDGKNSITMSNTHTDRVFTKGAGEAVNQTPVTSSVEEPCESARLARSYPLYPSYPSTDGADPLDSLISLAEVVPAPKCLDCDAEEELVPGAHWYACRSCTPGTFDSRS